MSYASSDELKIFPNETFPEPPEKPSFYEPFKCHTRAWGFHREGNYIMAYTPEAKQDNSSSKNLKIVIYLHGFAFGNPFFYDAHLQHLAKQGYYVFFPDYQKDKYRDSQKPEPSEQIHSINDLIDAVVESLDSTPKEMIEKLI